MKHPDASATTIGPWMSKFAPPKRPMVVHITKEQAGDWLDYRVPDYRTNNQRKLSASVVAKYTIEMNAGRWRLTPEGLMLDINGWLFDGQHRLQALRNSDLPGLDFWVFPDQESDLFSVVNVGFLRQARQLYTGPNASTVTASVRYLGEERGKYINTMTPAASLQLVAQWPEVQTHASGVMAAYLRSRVPASPHLAVMAQAERSVHRDKIPAWLSGVAYGTDLPPGDPRWHLRERFAAHSGRQRSTDIVYNTIAKAWNAYAKDEKLQVLSWRAVEGTVPIIGMGDSPEE